MIASVRGVDASGKWEDLQRLLVSFARQELKKWIGCSFPQKAIYLQSMIQAERNLLSVPVVSTATLRTIASACKIKPLEMDVCFSWLQYSVGALFFDSIPRLKDMVVIDPLWLVRVMTSLTKSRSPILSQRDLASIFALPFFAPSSLDAICKLLEGFSMIHELRNAGKESFTKFVIPFLLSDEEPALSFDDNAIVLGHTWHKYVRIYEVSALVHGLFDQLFVRLMHVTSRHCSFWRNGFTFMLESPLFGWDIVVAKLETQDDLSSFSRISFEVISSDRSGRILHIVSTTVESLVQDSFWFITFLFLVSNIVEYKVRGWFPGSHFRRIVQFGDSELDLDILGEELMLISSIKDLRSFSKSVLKASRNVELFYWNFVC
jgi:hypothetical protein